MVSVRSFRVGCVDPLHATNVAKKDTMVGNECIVCEFDFIVIRWATSRLNVPFSLHAQCINLHL